MDGGRCWPEQQSFPSAQPSSLSGEHKMGGCRDFWTETPPEIPATGTWSEKKIRKIIVLGAPRQSRGTGENVLAVLEKDGNGEKESASNSNFLCRLNHSALGAR